MITREVTPEQFVKIWQTAKSLGDVSQELGINNRNATGRAAHYRKHGVLLKKFKGLRGRPSTDWAALSQYAAKLAKLAGI